MDKSLLGESPVAGRPAIEDLTVVVAGADRKLVQTVAESMAAAGWKVSASDAEPTDDDLSSANALVCCSVNEQERSWLSCSPEEWRHMREQGLDDVFSLVQTYANAHVSAEVPGVAILVTGSGHPESAGQSVLDSCIAWGVRGLVRNAAVTYARKGVRVNGVLVDTTEPDAGEGVAALARFLIEQGKHITGQTIPVADGQTLL